MARGEPPQRGHCWSGSIPSGMRDLARCCCQSRMTPCMLNRDRGKRALGSRRVFPTQGEVIHAQGHSIAVLCSGIHVPGLRCREVRHRRFSGSSSTSRTGDRLSAAPATETSGRPFGSRRQIWRPTSSLSSSRSAKGSTPWSSALTSWPTKRGPRSSPMRCGWPAGSLY